MADTSATTSQTLQESAKTARLPRELGLLGVFVFSLVTIGLATSAMEPFTSMAGQFPGVSLAAMLGIGLVICLLQAFNYAVIGSAVPHSAADYVLTSRVLSPVVGFGASLLLLIFGCQVLGTLLAQVGQVTIPVFLQAISIVGNVPTMILAAHSVSSPQGIAISGSMGIFLAYLLSILPLRVNQRIMQVGLVLIGLGWLLVIVQLLFPQAAFPSSWDSFMGAGSYSMQIRTASLAGMRAVGGWDKMVTGGLFFAFWIFFGFQSPVSMAGEVKRPQSALFLGSAAALVITAALAAGADLLLTRLVPAEWISAQSFLFLNGKTAMPRLTFYAAILRPNSILVSMLLITWVFATLTVAQAYLTFLSRILVAWSEDNLIPRAIGYIHPQFNSPIVSVLIVAVLAQGSVVLVAQTGKTLETIYAFIFFAVLGQVFPLLALVLAPWLKRSWFLTRDRFVTAGIGPVPYSTLTSLLMLGYSGWIVAYGLQLHTLYYQTLQFSLILVGVFLVALGYYLLRRAYLHNRGRDLGQRFTAFPQDEAE